MPDALFIPTSDKVHFPLILRGKEDLFLPMMGTAKLEFYAPKRLETCNSGSVAEFVGDFRDISGFPEASS
jgi:hypothetical protein